MLMLIISLSFSLVLFPNVAGLKWGKIDIKLNNGDTYYIERYEEANIPLTLTYIPYYVAYYPIWAEIKIIDKPSWISVTNEEACFLLYPKSEKTITVTFKMIAGKIGSDAEGKVTLLVTGRILTRHLFREIEPAKVEITVKYKLNPPVINIVYPKDNATVKGVVVIRGKVIGEEVNSVEIKIDDGNWKEVKGNAYWEYVLDTRKLDNGIHVVKARIFDGVDYSTTSIRINVKNKNTLATSWPLYFIIPTVSIIIIALIRKIKR